MSCCSKKEEVQEYYGKELQSSADLKTNTCQIAQEEMTGLIKKIRSLLHDDTLASFYGCGSPIPPALNGAVVLDLGCGSGVDVFVCSALVGDGGKVIGVDMTEEQLAKANKHVQYHFEKFKVMKEDGYFGKRN
eukprot:TRINITY_DN5469_c0_g1_i3.p1 TRINITY_DN5469_c0_g1~~TRINITY_DN5469_c0_g1_i3.p1  ORF type:complete len:147 (+),score=33.92 TRINITY_DN5469_c0_g1_i3:44-442(+)